MDRVYKHLHVHHKCILFTLSFLRRMGTKYKHKYTICTLFPSTNGYNTYTHVYHSYSPSFDEWIHHKKMVINLRNNSANSSSTYTYTIHIHIHINIHRIIQKSQSVVVMSLLNYLIIFLRILMVLFIHIPTNVLNNVLFIYFQVHI